MSKYSLTITFQTLEELSDFITLYNKMYNKAEEKKTVKTISDKRGSKTITLHQKAKEYRLLHPELSYRDCLVEVSKQEPKQPELIEVEQEQEQNKKTFEIFEDNLII